MNIDASLLVIMGIFWVTYVILRVFFFKPLFALLAAREAQIEGAREQYEAAVREADAAIASQRERLQGMRQEASALRDQLRREGEEQRQSTLVAARAAAHEELEAAGAALSAQVARERQTLERDARRIADEMARRLLGRTA